MLASQASLLLGFPDTPNQNSRYLVWRSDISGYMGQNGIISQTHAGAEKLDALKLYSISHQFARSYKASYLKGRNSAALQEALQTLLMDIRAKQSKRRKIAAVEDVLRGAGKGGEPQDEDDAALEERKRVELPPPAGGSGPGPSLSQELILPQRRSVLVHRIDPEAISASGVADIEILDHAWAGNGVFIYPGMVYAHTIADLITLATMHLEPEEPPRRERNLLGAITDPIYDPDDHRKIIGAPDCVMMTLNGNVESWILMSRSDPLRLMLILARQTAANGLEAPQTPCPDGWSHIDNEVFETTEEPQDITSGDEGPVTKKQRLPRSDKGWQVRLQGLRNRRDRTVEYINDLEQKYLERHPGGIIEGDPLFEKQKIWTAAERAEARRENTDDD